MSLKEITATEEIMRLAINGQKHVDSLIGYYRDQIDKFNEERVEWALNYQICKDNATHKHLIEHQIEDSKVRINELEAKLGIIRANLNHQRQKYFKKLEDNEAIKDRLEENKKRLREMMAICKPISIHNSSKFINRPHDKNISKLNDSALSSNKETGNSKKTQLELELINISKEHDRRREEKLKIIDLLKNQLDQIVVEHSNRGAEGSKSYKQALQKLSTVESKIMNMTIQYFKLQMVNYEEQRKIQEESQILRLKNISMMQRLKMLEETHCSQFKMIESQVKKKNKDFKTRYDKELHRKEEHLTILKEQNERINDIYLNKMKKLETQLREKTELYRNIDDKTKVETHSLKSQIKILNNRLEKDGIRKMRQEIANDYSEEESSATISMQELENINKEVKLLEKQIK